MVWGFRIGEPLTTFNELIDSTLLQLSGFSTSQDQATYLTSDITSSATAIPVFDTTAVSRGLLEIGDELLWVDSVSSAASQLTAPPYGRGYRSTTAAAHVSGTRVVASPLMPRTLVKKYINEAIGAVFPSLFTVAATDFTSASNTDTYSLPAGAQAVLSVSWQPNPGQPSHWQYLSRYTVDSQMNVTSFATGAAIRIKDRIPPNCAVRVVYTTAPGLLSASADNFATVTGLPASCEDVIRLGAVTRAIPFLDTPHFAGTSAEADFSGQQRPVGSATQQARQLLQMYAMRLQQESSRLQGQFPVRVRFTN